MKWEDPSPSNHAKTGDLAHAREEINELLLSGVIDKWALLDVELNPSAVVSIRREYLGAEFTTRKGIQKNKQKVYVRVRGEGHD